MMMQHIRNVLILLALPLSIAITGGCASNAVKPAEPPHAEDYKDAATVQKIKQAIDADQLLVHDSHEATVTVTTNGGEPVTTKMTVEKTDTGWTRTVSGYSVAYLRLEPDGSVVLPQQDDLLEKVRVVYDPPLLLLPARLGESEIPKLKSKVRVTELHSGAQRASGECVSTIAEIHERQIKTPAGTVNGYVVREVRNMTLSVAKVGAVIDTTYGVEMGAVAQEYWETRKMFGLFDKHTHTIIQLAR